eukprot:7249910-Ditylum_brightwellii.AAC.1
MPEIVTLSSWLDQGLINLVEDEALLPFVNNEQFAGKGVEMLLELFSSHSRFGGKTDYKMQQEFTTSCIKAGESLDDFALCLR